MLHVEKHVIDTRLLYIHRAIFHYLVVNGTRMSFFNN
ncbi:RAxF-45 family protein [Aquibacillus kalidii]|nr:RAxF-45 family protein [Aquibacillus kalidii]